MPKTVTLKEIAEELGISAMTVSRAINNRSNVQKKTKERILAKAREMGYTPNHVAKSLVSKKTNTIGVVIPDISHHFFSQVISGIEEVTYANNYQLLLTNSAENFERERKALETLRSQRVDGIMISCTMEVQDYSYYQQIVNDGVPIVFFDRGLPDLGISIVKVDDRTGSKKMTAHMINHGYKKIAYFRGPEISIGRDRYEGFLEEMRKHGLQINDKWIIESGFQEKGGYQAMKKILNLPKNQWPRAVVTVNDPVAIGAIEALKEVRLHVPDDFAIGGFSDDIRAQLMNVPLTTIRQRPFDIGRIAAEKLLQTIENEDEPVENREINTELIVRKSCGCNAVEYPG